MDAKPKGTKSKKTNEAWRQRHFGDKGGRYDIDWRNPWTLNEKILYLFFKYHRGNEASSWIENKLTAKLLIRDILGAKYVAHLYATFKNLNELYKLVDMLPQRFVVKKVIGCSGEFVRIVDKSKIRTVAELKSFLAPLEYGKPTERSAKTTSRVAQELYIVEEYLPSTVKCASVLDIKVFCSFGKAFCVVAGFDPNCLGISKPINKNQTMFTTLNFIPLPVSYCIEPSTTEIERPQTWPEMKILAEKLSAHSPFLRIDFYETVNDHGERVVKIGEITNFPASGCGAINPPFFDLLLGEFVHIPDQQTLDILQYRDRIAIEQWTAELQQSKDLMQGIVVPGWENHCHPCIRFNSRLNPHPPQKMGRKYQNFSRQHPELAHPLTKMHLQRTLSPNSPSHYHNSSPPSPFSMQSCPMYGRSASGRTIDPSCCW